jgi:hypothetical protein
MTTKEQFGIKEFGNSFKNGITNRKEEVKKNGTGPALGDAFFTTGDYENGQSVIVDAWYERLVKTLGDAAAAAGTEN